MTTTNAPTIARKSFPIHAFKALPAEGPGVYSSIVAVFGNVDHIKDRIISGAFEKSLERWRASGDPAPVIFSHQWDDIDSHLGVTLEAKELFPGDPLLPPELAELGGLWTKNRLDVDTHLPAKRVFELLERRSLREFSFAYDVIDSKRQADGVLDLLELDLIESGPTLKGMNPMTQLLSRKSVEAFLSKAWLNLTGSAEELRAAVYDAAEDWAEETDTGNGGFYACYLEATFPDRVVVMIEGWSDPCGEGTYWELDVSFADGEATVSNPREVEITGQVGTKPVTDPDEAEVEVVMGTDEFGMMSRRKARLGRALGKSTTPKLKASTVSGNGDDEVDDNPEPGDGNGEDRKAKSEPGTGEAARTLLELELLELS